MTSRFALDVSCAAVQRDQEVRASASASRPATPFPNRLTTPARSRAARRGGGVVLQTMPQNPRDPDAEKGPSTFDVTHFFALSVIQILPLDHLNFLRPLSRTSPPAGRSSTSPPSPAARLSPFTQEYSRPASEPAERTGPTWSPAALFDQPRHARGLFRTRRGQRIILLIPINVPGGTGPNSGRFGTLGRNTFRGPHFAISTWR